MHRAAITLAAVVAAAVFAGSALAGGPPTANQVPRFWARAIVVVQPGQSIQAAINAARPYTRIVVLPGTYRESLTITKDGITLDGKGATLVPPAVPTTGPCDLGGPPAQNGICVLGQTDAMGNVTQFVRNDGVTGFTISGFPGTGIIALGAQDASFTSNTATDDGEYGIAAFSSSGTWVASNTTTGNDEAGIYIGDSPDARATVERNTTWGNGFGIFVRDAEGAWLTWNDVRFNCLGILVLADAPGPAGNVTMRWNSVVHNNRACPANDEGGPISGIGIALVGANDSYLNQNEIKDNRPGGDTDFSGGLVVISGEGGTPPTNNVATGNFLAQNDPDIFWDGTGTGNVLQPNACFSSVPAGLC
jgi:parallel beta-helix repeat protein